MRHDEQASKNLELARHLMGLVLDAPSHLRSLAGRTLVFMPTDDPDLATANEAMGERLTARGEEVTYVLVMPDERAVPTHRGKGLRPGHAAAPSAG